MTTIETKKDYSKMQIDYIVTDVTVSPVFNIFFIPIVYYRD